MKTLTWLGVTLGLIGLARVVIPILERTEELVSGNPTLR